MGVLLITVIAIGSVAAFFGSRLRLLAAVVEADRNAMPVLARAQRPLIARSRPRPVRTGRLAKLGYRHHRERVGGALI